MYKPNAVLIKNGYYAVEETNWKPVSKTGLVINKWGKETRGFLGDYYRTNIRPNQVMAVHRIVALTYIPHNGDVKNLDVNHIDGNKLNNSVDNLEWVDRSENNRHAVRIGLASSDRKIFVKDLYTSKVFRFKTIRAASRFIGCYQNSLHAYLHQRKLKPFRGKWSVRIADEPWPVYDNINPTAFGYNVKNEHVVVGVNTKGGKHEVYPSIESVRKYVNPNIKLDDEYNGYIYCLIDDLINYSYSIGDVLANCTYVTRGLMMSDEFTIKKPKSVEVIFKDTGKVVKYSSLRKFSSEVLPNIPYNTLRARIFKHKGEIGNMIIRYIGHS